MCGIFASINIDGKKVAQCEPSLAHRGPDDAGVYEVGTTILAHRRLSILDLSPRGHQPMHSADKRWSIIFNGEIYNFKELRSKLEGEGYTFESDGDTAVIVAGVAAHGVSFFKKMCGMWAIALFDEKERKLYLSRDHFGIKPLYYFIEGNRFACASEVKALTPLVSKLTPSSLYPVYFNLGYFPGDTSSFEEIKKVLPATVVEIAVDTLKKTSHPIPLPNPGTFSGTYDDAVVRMDETIKKSVEAHFVSDVPVALLLSGGTDSSLIAAEAKALGFSPECHHIAISGSTDTGYAEKVAAYLNLPFKRHDLTLENFSERYEAIWKTLDQPCSDVSIIPTTMVYASIAGSAKVVLSGEGGDELFGGYIRHSALKNVAGIHKGSSLDAFLERISVLRPLALRMRKFTEAMRNDLIGLYISLTRSADVSFGYAETRNYLFNFFTHHPWRDIVSPYLFFDLALYLPNMLMYKNDTASMAYSIEARVPLLDVEVMAESLSLPRDFLLPKKGEGKLLLKKILERHLPKNLIYRDKKGFGFSPLAYAPELFKKELDEAVRFHVNHREEFHLTPSFASYIEQHQGALLRKFPRLAFSLISNWRVWTTWGKL